MTTEFSVNKRDIQFVLHEQLQIEKLCKLPAFSEFNRELFDMVLDEAIKLGTDVLAPVNAPGDREGCHFENGEVRTPAGFREAFRKVAEGGWTGMVGGPEYGGQGLPMVMKAAAMEIFTGANAPLFLFTSVLTEGAAHLIERVGTEEQKKLYCEKMYTGQWGGTMCLTEPTAGSDVGNLKTSARKNGDHYLISGTKIFITSGEHDLTENIIHPVLARIEGGPPGTAGISLFVVPKFLVHPDGSLGDRNDVRCGGIEHKMGIHGSPTCVLNFGDEGACKGWLLGEEHRGMRAMFHLMNEARLEIGVGGFGLGSAAYLSALGYAQERAQGAHFSRVRDKVAPRVLLLDHPDVRRMMLFMKSLVDGMRSLLFSVATYIDLAEQAGSEEDRARYRHFVELLTPVCKSYAADMGFRVNETAMQVYGGYGYCSEYPVEQYCRDNKISSIYEGTNGIQALDLVGRKVVGTGGAYVEEYLELIHGFVVQHRQDDSWGGLVTRLDAAAGELSKVTRAFVDTMPSDPAIPLLWATPYQDMFGHVATAYYLLEGAVIASRKLKECQDQTGIQDVARLLGENNEAAFYHGRIASARFFVNCILPQVRALSEAILSGDRSALDVTYPA